MAIDRRRFLTGAGAMTAAAGLGLWAARPSVLGRGGHDPYFRGLEASLRVAGIARPTMIVDLDRLDVNIDAAMGALGHRALRVVAKSLPSPRLIDYVLDRSGATRVMVFHQPFASAVAELRPEGELLFGKPMPVAAAAEFYRHQASGSFSAERHLEWLIDTPERLRQYAELAAGQDLRMRINVEIDVGLHRGGARDPRGLQGILDAVASDSRLEFSGIMGYEPHVVKMPDLVGGPEAEFLRVLDRYRAFLDVALAHAATDPPTRPLTLNAAGSPTYALWREVAGLANELSIGSGFVMPLDFDLPTLSEHVAGLFIATPVLKATKGVQIAGLGAANDLWSAWDPNRAQSFFTYGGYWKARPVSPLGLIDNPVFGHSTNQEMLNGAKGIELEVDDFVFMRPTQSEFVMLQFGDLAIVRDGKIVDAWPVLDQSGTL